jgi:surface protein
MDVAIDKSKMEQEPSLDEGAMAAKSAVASSRSKPREDHKASSSRHNEHISSNDPAPFSDHPGAAAVLMIPALRVHNETTTHTTLRNSSHTAAPPPASTSASRTVHRPQQEELELGTGDSSVQQPRDKRKRLGTGLVLLGIVILFATAVIGGICGSGKCSSSNEGMVSGTAIPPQSASNASNVSNGPVAFESTEELYAAIDEYLDISQNNATANPPNESRVALKYGYPIGTWNVSLLTDFSRVFDPDRTANLNNQDRTPIASTSPFNEDLSGWNVSRATTMVGMFAYASSFNGSVSGWQTSKVTNMSFMFYSATHFDGDLSSLDTGSVQNATSMFMYATRFTGKGLEQWNTSSMLEMKYMFLAGYSFNGNLSKWDTSNILDMSSTFAACSSFNADISNWNVDKVANMKYMFFQASTFNGNVQKNGCL